MLDWSKTELSVSVPKKLFACGRHGLFHQGGIDIIFHYKFPASLNIAGFTEEKRLLAAPIICCSELFSSLVALETPHRTKSSWHTRTYQSGSCPLTICRRYAPAGRYFHHKSCLMRRKCRRRTVATKGARALSLEGGTSKIVPFSQCTHEVGKQTEE